MSDVIRFLRVLTRWNDAPTHGLLDEVAEEFRVGPTDIDLNLHLNNARYLKYMDRVRLEYFVTTGLLRRMYEQKTNPIVSSTEITYVRELRTFQRFRVTARLVGYDDRYLYFEQRFLADGRLATHAHLRLACVHQGKARPLAELRDAVGLPEPRALPESVERWREMLAAKRRSVVGEAPAVPASERIVHH